MSYDLLRLSPYSMICFTLKTNIKNQRTQVAFSFNEKHLTPCCPHKAPPDTTRMCRHATRQPMHTRCVSFAQVSPPEAPCLPQNQDHSKTLKPHSHSMCGREDESLLIMPKFFFQPKLTLTLHTPHYTHHKHHTTSTTPQAPHHKHHTPHYTHHKQHTPQAAHTTSSTPHYTHHKQHTTNRTPQTAHHKQHTTSTAHHKQHTTSTAHTHNLTQFTAHVHYTKRTCTT